jgi:RHS repeat-associated protein
MGNSETRIQYTIGDDLISQTHSIGADTWSRTWTVSPTQYFLYDGHGSTRQLVTADLTNQSSYSYDGYGVLLRDVDSFPSQIMGPPLPGEPGTGQFGPSTKYLYCGEQYDWNLSQYYLRARYYNPQNGLFNQMDPYAGNTQDPQSLHKYTYCHNDPVNYVDPAGEAELLAEQLTVSMVMAEMMTAMIPYIKLSLVALTLAATICIIHDLAQQYIEAGMTEAAEKIRSNTQVVIRAIDDVATALGKAVKQLRKLKFFPIIKSMTPDIYAFNVTALTTHPWWFMLSYVGVGPLGDYIEAGNRSNVEAQWGYLRATAKPGYELDEFPYARTIQGGFGALAHMVDWKQHRLQGGYFGAFCRWTMHGLPGKFIVVPIPL